MRSDFFGAIRLLILLTILAAASIMCAAECVDLEGESAPPPEPVAVAAANQPEESIEPHAAIPEPTIEPVQTAQEPETTTPTQISIQTIYSKPYAPTDEERAIVEAVVAAESGTEDFIGQCLVAQCVRNTAEATGMRPDDVVLQEGQYAPMNEELRYLVEKAVSAVFDQGHGATTE